MPGRPHGEPQRERRHHVHAHAHEDFTGSVSFSASGLPTGVTAAFNPASTTGNSTAVTFTAGGERHARHRQRDDLGRGHGPHHAHGAGGAHGGERADRGVVTATGAVASNSPWFAEEQVRFATRRR